MDLARNLKHETVSRLNPTAPWQVQPGQTVADAVQMMRDKRVGCVLVCEGRRIVGIFTERDLLRRVLAVGKPLCTRVGECMTAGPGDGAAARSDPCRPALDAKGRLPAPARRGGRQTGRHSVHQTGRPLSGGALSRRGVQSAAAHAGCPPQARGCLNPGPHAPARPLSPEDGGEGSKKCQPYVQHSPAHVPGRRSRHPANPRYRYAPPAGPTATCSFHRQPTGRTGSHTAPLRAARRGHHPLCGRCRRRHATRRQSVRQRFGGLRQ